MSSSTQHGVGLGRGRIFIVKRADAFCWQIRRGGTGAPCAEHPSQRAARHAAIRLARRELESTVLIFDLRDRLVHELRFENGRAVEDVAEPALAESCC
jgi:hypothetical protein